MGTGNNEVSSGRYFTFLTSRLCDSREGAKEEKSSEGAGQNCEDAGKVGG